MTRRVATLWSLDCSLLQANVPGTQHSAVRFANTATPLNSQNWHARIGHAPIRRPSALAAANSWHVVSCLVSWVGNECEPQKDGPEGAAN